MTWRRVLTVWALILATVLTAATVVFAWHAKRTDDHGRYCRSYQNALALTIDALVNDEQVPPKSFAVLSVSLRASLRRSIATHNSRMAKLDVMPRFAENDNWHSDITHIDRAHELALVGCP